MTRIIAGVHGGRRLSAPTGSQTRPTADRVREALFSALSSMTDMSGARFADFYAGSGAVGLEALSRGAAFALLVESDARAARTVRDNIRVLRADAAARLLTGRVEQVLGAPPGGEPFDVVFADPPYALAEDRLTAVQHALVAGGWLADDAVVVIERATRASPLTWVDGLTADRSRRYGETTLWYGRRS
ncbi:16S rRNA (guanine(966)-N(2))-methyltransferase RsmD [Mangrovihabitans endophyticus]|uniref:DNA methylase n=1 Tax=Mangrovihabitans endophyticus TaxID=1751298 RepID=A0A8J3C5F2_9ACTN|nr:16S rRNA (guanine(966)-N(2))-methyltransferase RsmD [Mangrovihabitans endophyticus]GGL10860.1 DNA methylase [Mangrovihabitans endophyticus]